MHNARMKLRAYMQKEGLGDAQFAERIGVHRQTVRQYREGKRIPRPEIMRRIVEVTGGEVTAQDFYDAAPARAEAEQ